MNQFPALTGKRLRAKWIEAHYEAFASAHGSGVALKDFLQALAGVMERKRVDRVRKGERDSYTVYVVPPANVVPLEAARRA